MKNDFGGLFVGWGEPIYVKLKEVEKLAVKHFNENNVHFRFVQTRTDVIF